MSGAARWPQVKSIFHAVLDRPPEAREAFLEQVTGGDLELYREVASLLAAQEEAGAFLSRPAMVDPGPAEIDGRGRIGPYRVLGKVGHGGMGVVYRAVRDDDVFEKTVALKLVPGGAGAPHLERLTKERQILARLQHPHIATILDGGTTEDGQPYLVMEFVEGEPMDVYCAARRLGTRERLEIFATVCGAVHYAHQNLVVHRDLKPANILVTRDGQPKLLDFGIAKLLAAGVDPDEAPTATLLPMMTPEYASPEQVRGGPVTTASDVYSLGVVLYEMLTGARPYHVRTDSLEEIVRAVCETEPRLPSAAVTWPQEKGTPRPSPSELRGDLDTIVMKALRKEPERRYLSALALAEDIRRFLTGRPVAARGDTVGYRLSKFVGRHKAGVAAAVLVAVSVIGGLALTVRQARIAEANRRQAEQRFNDVRRLAQFVMFDMHDAIAGLPGSTPARKQLVERSLEYLDRLAGEASSDPALLEEIATGYLRLSEVQGATSAANLGNVAGAVESARKAVALRERVSAAKPADWSSVAALALSYGKLAGLLPPTTAAQFVGKMKATLDRVPSGEDGGAAVLEAWELYWFTRAVFAFDTGDHESAREGRRRQVEFAEKLLALDPQSVKRQRNLALAYKNYGAILQWVKEFGAAGEIFEKARALDQAIVDKDPSNPHRRLDLSFSLGSVGSVQLARGDPAGALVAYRRALELRQAVHEEDPANEFAFNAVVRAHSSLANVAAATGDVESAIVELREVLALRQGREARHPSAYGPRTWEASFHWSVGDAVAELAGEVKPATKGREHWRRARQEYARALAIWTDLAGGRPLDGAHANNLERLRESITRCDRALAGGSTP